MSAIMLQTILNKREKGVDKAETLSVLRRIQENLESFLYAVIKNDVKAQQELFQSTAGVLFPFCTNPYILLAGIRTGANFLNSKFPQIEKANLSIDVKEKLLNNLCLMMIGYFLSRERTLTLYINSNCEINLKHLAEAIQQKSQPDLIKVLYESYHEYQSPMSQISSVLKQKLLTAMDRTIEELIDVAIEFERVCQLIPNKIKKINAEYLENIHDLYKTVALNLQHNINLGKISLLRLKDLTAANVSKISFIQSLPSPTALDSKEYHEWYSICHLIYLEKVLAHHFGIDQNRQIGEFSFRLSGSAEIDPLHEARLSFEFMLKSSFFKDALSNPFNAKQLPSKIWDKYSNSVGELVKGLRSYYKPGELLKLLDSNTIISLNVTLNSGGGSHAILVMIFDNNMIIHDNGGVYFPDYCGAIWYRIHNEQNIKTVIEFIHQLSFLQTSSVSAIKEYIDEKLKLQELYSISTPVQTARNCTWSSFASPCIMFSLAAHLYRSLLSDNHQIESNIEIVIQGANKLYCSFLLADKIRLMTNYNQKLSEDSRNGYKRDKVLLVSAFLRLRASLQDDRFNELLHNFKEMFSKKDIEQFKQYEFSQHRNLFFNLYSSCVTEQEIKLFEESLNHYINARINNTNTDETQSLKKLNAIYSRNLNKVYRRFLEFILEYKFNRTNMGDLIQANGRPSSLLEQCLTLNYQSHTLLTCAIFEKRDDIVAILMSPNVQIDFFEPNSDTLIPLFSACLYNNSLFLEKFLEMYQFGNFPEFDINQARFIVGQLKEEEPRRIKVTPLHSTILSDSLDALKIILLFPGLQINKLSGENNLPALTTAIKLERLDHVRVLLSHPDIDPNKQDSYGHTPLMHAVVQKNLALVQLILSHPATDISQLNFVEKSALTLAIEDRSAAIIDAILAKLLQRYSDKAANSSKPLLFKYQVQQESASVVTPSIDDISFDAVDLQIEIDVNLRLEQLNKKRSLLYDASSEVDLSWSTANYPRKHNTYYKNYHGNHNNCRPCWPVPISRNLNS